MNKFVYGNCDRIFINTSLGCNAKCKYCYLPYLEMPDDKKKISAREAINLVESLPFYKSGEDGTIISIGCYSECMDYENINETIEIIKYFSGKRNYIQLATKKKIDESMIEEFKKELKYKHQLTIFISMPTYTRSNEIEINTDSPQLRVKNIKLCKKHEIDVVLYIKPFLNDITQMDEEKFIEIIEENNISVVIGAYLSTEKNNSRVLVGEYRLYEYFDDDIKKMVANISRKTEVFSHSIDYILKLREEKWGDKK